MAFLCRPITRGYEALAQGCKTSVCCQACALSANNKIVCSAFAECTPGASSMVPTAGLVSWFKSSDLKDGNNWASSVGSFVAKPTAGSVKVTTTTGHRAVGPVVAVSGDASSAYTFGGEILPAVYTICTMTRYNGDSRGRILTGERSNWLHGHWSSGAGVAHYDGWLGASSGQVDDLEWVILCGTSKSLLLHGKVIATRGNEIAGSQGVAINGGAIPNEKSDWMVAEVITWNRALSEKEMQDASAYLQKILDDGGLCSLLLLSACSGVCVCNVVSQRL